MPIQFAPTELLQQIFQYLPKSSLLTCATVCINWKAPAIQLFYENVELSEKTKAIWLHIVHQTPAAGTNVGNFVKKLTVSLAFSTTMTQGEFLEVLSYLPFVRAIDLNLSGYKLHYLAYLNKRGTGCVTYLEDIYTGDLFTDFQMQQYFLCAYSFRHSLKNLTLKNPNAIYAINRQFGSALSFLNKFENLSHVSIINDSHNTEDELATLLRTFHSCPKLVSFLYQNNNLPLDNEVEYLDSMIVGTNSMESKKKYSSSSTIPNKLQNIELQISKLTEHYIRNILSYFPTHLNTLTISMTHTDYCAWIEELNELFAFYLGYVKNLKISISNLSRRGYSIGGRKPIKKSTEVLSKYWSFVRSVLGGRQLFCQMRITFAKLGTKPDLTIERDHRNFTLSYNLDNAQDLGNCLEEFSACYSSSNPATSNNQDFMLDFLLVEVPTQNDALSNSKWLEIINSVSTYSCPPQSIVIKCLESGSTDGYWLQLGSSTPAIHPYYDHGNRTFDNLFTLKYALLKNINLQTLSPKTLSEMLPDIKMLKVINCKLSQDTLPNTFTIDISGLDHLKQLVLDMAFLDTAQRHHVLIRVDMEEDSQHLCYSLYASGSQEQSDSMMTENCGHCGSNEYYSSVVTIKCKRLDQIVSVKGKEESIIAIFDLLKKSSVAAAVSLL